MTSREGNGMPWWFRQAFGPGLAVFLLLWVLGLMPFLPNPIWTQVFAAIDKQGQATQELLRVTTQDLLKIQRMTCAGVWKGEPTVQRECWGKSP